MHEPIALGLTDYTAHRLSFSVVHICFTCSPLSLITSFFSLLPDKYTFLQSCKMKHKCMLHLHAQIALDLTKPAETIPK